MLAALAFGVRLTIGPAALTYPELAAALTKVGMPTVASASLSSRAAYVSMRDRSPESLRRLLGEVLGIAFQKEGDGWRMIVDPSVKERDRRFLLAYQRAMRNNLRDVVAEGRTLTQGSNYKDFFTRLRADIAEIEGRGVATPARIAEIRARMQLAVAAYWSGLEGLAAPEATAALMGNAVRSFRFDTLAQPPSLYAGTLTNDSPVEQIFAFDPRSGTLWVDTHPGSPWMGELPFFTRFHFVLGATDYAFQINSYRFSVSAEPKSIAETFRNMGPDGKRYLDSLASVDLPDEPLGERAVGALSEALEQLPNQEAVVELSVRFDPFPGNRHIAGSRLRTLFLDRPLASWTGWDALKNLSRSSLAQKADDRRRAERDWPWRIVEREGAWLAINPYAFLDRTQPVAAAPYVRLAKVMAEFRKTDAGPAPTWEVARRMVAAVRPETSLAKMNPLYRNPTGYDYRDLATVVEELSRFAETARPAFWTRLRENREVTLPTTNGFLKTIAVPVAGNVCVLRVERYEGERCVAGAEAILDGRGISKS